MSIFKQEHEQRLARVQLEEQEMAAAKSWMEFLQIHPEIRLGGMANRGMFQNWFGSDYPAAFTVPNLQEAYANPALRRQLALDDSEGSGEREKLIAEYRQAISGWSQDAIAGELNKAKYWTNDQIREKLATVQGKKALQSKNSTELRQVIKENYTPPEPDELPVQHSRASLLALKGPEFRKVCERYGVAAVTRRLNQR